MLMLNMSKYYPPFQRVKHKTLMKFLIFFHVPFFHSCRTISATSFNPKESEKMPIEANNDKDEFDQIREIMQVDLLYLYLVFKNICYFAWLIRLCSSRVERKEALPLVSHPRRKPRRTSNLKFSMAKEHRFKQTYYSFCLFLCTYPLSY